MAAGAIEQVRASGMLSGNRIKHNEVAPCANRLVLKKLVLLFASVFLHSPLALAQTKESRSLYPVCQHAKCGYIDRTGNVVIPLQFDEAFDYSDGLARIVVGGRFGFIDVTGKIVIEPRFGAAKDFSDGLAAVSTTLLDGKWGYIDHAGAITIPLQFTSAKNFSEALRPSRSTARKVSFTNVRAPDCFHYGIHR